MPNSQVKQLKTATSEWDSVEECIEWINTFRNPNAMVAEVIKHNLDVNEDGFALDLLKAFVSR